METHTHTHTHTDGAVGGEIKTEGDKWSKSDREVGNGAGEVSRPGRHTVRDGDGDRKIEKTEWR